MGAMTGYGAALSALGIAANAYGEHQGIQALSRAKGAQNREQIAFDAQRQQQLGGYLDDTAPIGLTESANAAEQAGTINAARSPGVAQAAGSALGVHAPSGISAASRADVRAGAIGRRVANEQIRRQRLGQSIDQIEQDRANSALLYPGLDRRAAATGSGYRQLGGYLGAGGSAVSAYGMMSEDGTGGYAGADPAGYSNNPYATGRAQGPSQYRG